MNFSLFEGLEAKDQLKFVINDEKDYSYAKEILSKYDIRASIIFQPVYGADIAELADLVLKDRLNSVKILPQLHKFIWGDKRGV